MLIILIFGFHNFFFLFIGVIGTRWLVRLLDIGEILIAVSNKYIVFSWLDIFINYLELCIVSVKFNISKKLIISSTYFPPNFNSYLYNEYFNIIDNPTPTFPDTNLSFFGDLNITSLNINFVS